MLTLTFLVKTVIELYVMVLLIRIWMQWARCDFYNPFAQFVVKITQPIIGPMRKVIPSLGPIDTSSLLLAFILATLKYPSVADSGRCFITRSNESAGWPAVITEVRRKHGVLGYYCSFFNELDKSGSQPYRVCINPDD